jgi:hypothetical protein
MTTALEDAAVRAALAGPVAWGERPSGPVDVPRADGT